MRRTWGNRSARFTRRRIPLAALGVWCALLVGLSAVGVPAASAQTKTLSGHATTNVGNGETTDGGEGQPGERIPTKCYHLPFRQTCVVTFAGLDGRCHRTPGIPPGAALIAHTGQRCYYLVYLTGLPRVRCSPGHYCPASGIAVGSCTPGHYCPPSGSPRAPGGGPNPQPPPPPGSPGNPLLGRASKDRLIRYPTHYRANLLGRRITVTVGAGTTTASQQQVLLRKLGAAIADINRHSKDLTASETKIIQNVKGITLQSGRGRRTGIDPPTGVYNLLPNYVWYSNTHWLASTIAHDSYHVLQYKQSGNNPNFYNPSTAARLERAADNFEIRVGAKLGLSPAQLRVLKNDTHTLYNTRGY